MPIYEYVCKSCGHELDALQKMSDAPLTECPDCGAPALKRKISAPRFRLKGSGWYETDFKSDGDKKRNLADDAGKAPKDGEGKTETKKDGKSESATEAKPAKKTGDAKGDGSKSSGAAGA